MLNSDKLLAIIKSLAFLLALITLISGLKVTGGLLRKAEIETGADLNQIITPRKISPDLEEKIESARVAIQKKEMDGDQVKASIAILNKSGLFGSPPKPKPAMLIGIAGDLAFIQTGSGGMQGITVGETFQNIKLLEIDTNRVLIEEDGTKKELVIHSGMGSDSLMNRDKQDKNNNQKQQGKK